MTALVGVALLGALGAGARHVIDRLVTRRVGGHRPWGTFGINALGSFLLGLITGLALHHHLDDTTRTVLGTGFCGAFTTFSTFAHQTHRLAVDGHRADAAANVGVGLIVGLALAAAGLGLATLA